MADVLLAGLVEVGWERLGGGGQLEVGEMAPQLLVEGCLGSSPAPMVLLVDVGLVDG